MFLSNEDTKRLLIFLRTSLTRFLRFERMQWEDSLRINKLRDTIRNKKSVIRHVEFHTPEFKDGVRDFLILDDPKQLTTVRRGRNGH
jgi:hypothetical protein